MNGRALCADNTGRHVPLRGTIKDYQSGDTETAECGACNQEIRRFYVDGDDDRRGGWSPWTAPRYIIHEIDLAS